MSDNTDAEILELRKMIHELVMQVGELKVQIALFSERSNQTRTALDDLIERLKPIEKAATQHAAVFAFILAIGGILGAVIPWIIQWWKAH